VSTRPATRTTSSRPDPRTESGERRIELPADLQATRVSERFRLPDEALPSEPPPPAPSPGNDAEPRALGAATAHIPIPEKIRLLNAALPTPHSFEPMPLAIPATTPVPHIDVDLDAEGERAEGSDVADAYPLAPPATSAQLVLREGRSATARRIASAVALFVILVSVSAVVIVVCAGFLFR